MCCLKYDWLHLHHERLHRSNSEKFYKAYRTATWYQEEVESQSASAQLMGFQKVSENEREKVGVTIRNFVLGGGFLLHVLGDRFI